MSRAQMTLAGVDSGMLQALAMSCGDGCVCVCVCIRESESKRNVMKEGLMNDLCVGLFVLTAQ